MNMKKSIWLPLLLFIVGLAVYVYFGIEYNAWIENLTLILFDAAIVAALYYVLKKKEQYMKERKEVNKQ